MRAINIPLYLLACCTHIQAGTTEYVNASGQKRLVSPPILVYTIGNEQDELRPIVQKACQYWNEQAKRILLLPGHKAYGLDFQAPIGLVTISYATKGILKTWPPNRHGLADYTFQPDPYINGGKIYVRQTTRRDKQIYLQNIITHELGHVLGLDHDRQAKLGNLMGPILPNARLYSEHLLASKRSLNQLRIKYGVPYGRAKD